MHAVPADPDDLRYVLAISRSKSLIGASRALGVDKATVIRRIDALEDALGKRVIERAARGWTLTPAGEAVAEAAREVEGVLDRLASAISDDGGGIVRMTAPAFFARQFLIPEMGRFRAAHPRVDLRLITSNALLDLGRREADIAVRNVRPDRGNFVIRPLGNLGHAVYASRSYVELRGVPASREELRRHHLLGYESKLVFQPALQWIVDLGLPVALRVTDTLTLLDGIKAGLGIAALPCALGEADSELVRLEVGGRGTDDICCVYPEELRESPRIRAGVEWLADVWQHYADVLRGPA
jgi:DNA-binding transcriptional LysR family regulator